MLKEKKKQLMVDEVKEKQLIDLQHSPHQRTSFRNFIFQLLYMITKKKSFYRFRVKYLTHEVCS